MSEIQDIVRTFRSRGQFKGLGGELMKQACAVLIKKCSVVHFPIHLTDVVGKYKCYKLKRVLTSAPILSLLAQSINELITFAFMNNVDDWQRLLEECLSHEVSAVKLKAAEAHANFFVEYYVDVDHNARSAVVNRYLESLRSSNQSVRIGFAQAIGKSKNHTCLIICRIPIISSADIPYIKQTTLTLTLILRKIPSK